MYNIHTKKSQLLSIIITMVSIQAILSILCADWLRVIQFYSNVLHISVKCNTNSNTVTVTLSVHNGEE